MRSARAGQRAPLVSLAVLGAARRDGHERRGGVPDRPPTGRPHARGSISWLSAALLASWLVLSAPRHQRGSRRRAGSRVEWSGSSSGGAVLALAFGVAAEQRVRTPLVDLKMLRGRGVWTTNVVAVLVGWGMYSAFVLVPQQSRGAGQLAGGFDASVATAGLYLVPWTFALAIASSVSGRLSARFGSRLPLRDRLRLSARRASCGCSTSTISRGRSSPRRRPWARGRASPSPPWWNLVIESVGPEADRRRHRREHHACGQSMVRSARKWAARRPGRQRSPPTARSATGASR